MALINHGMGFMTKKMHDELVAVNGIVCHGENGIDAICANYPKLVVREKGEDKTIDCGGNMPALLGEQASAINNKKTAFIEYFPRAYTEYMAKFNAEQRAWQDNYDAVSALQHEIPP